ncbi:MAG: chromosomal replication initiator protein DnaA [Christensenellales bacterium]|jgi:chromosomal replication initiator protein
MQDLIGIWTALQRRLQKGMTPTSYNTWIAPLAPNSIAGSELVIYVPSKFTRDMLERNYTDKFIDALNAVAPGRELRPVFLLRQEVPGEPFVVPPSPAVNLNPRYTFDNFVVGSGNRFAHAAALAVAETPAQAYNPFFIYGGSGLGKTHLMHAIGHVIAKTNPSARIVYVTSEKFTNELITAIQTKKNQEFRDRYRSADVLLMDDIQFIASKEAAQEEFFHTFNALYEASRQIVLTSDKHPHNIPTLETRLRSRFEGGLIYDIQPPDIETRVAILRTKAAAENMDIDDDSMFFIANLNVNNVRVLEGYLSRVMMYARLAGEPITPRLCEMALHDVIPDQSQREIEPEFIAEVVASHYNLRVSDLKAKRRSQNIVLPRQVAMYLCRQYTDQSLSRIGECFNVGDHTTVIHACNKITELLDHDVLMRTTMEELTRQLRRERA